MPVPLSGRIYPQPSGGLHLSLQGAWPAREPRVVGSRHIMEDSSHQMMERHMLTSEPSYFNFLMKTRGLRRTPVPFARAAGVQPEFSRGVRLRSAIRFAAKGVLKGRVAKAA